MSKLRFNPSYFLLTLTLLGIEILIGIYPHDVAVRTYGELLIVALLYCFVQTFLKLPTVPLSLGILVFSYLVETSQCFHLSDHLGVPKPSLVRTLMGTHFTWEDYVNYTFGIGMVLGAEGLKQTICDHLSKKARSSGPSGDEETPSC